MERKKFQTESLETLIHIEGKNKNLEEIADLYIKKMEEGFDLTLEEMADYLKCSYRYTLKFQEHIRHIVIDQHVARKALVIHKKNTVYEEKFGHLFTNRKLFYRPDFERYVLDRAELVTTYRKYKMSDFDPEVIQHLSDNLEKMPPERFINGMLSIAHRKVVSSEPEEKVETLGSLPDDLYSVTSLMNHGFLTNPEEPQSLITWTHDRYIYHFLRDFGIKKVRIGNLIRYRREDLSRGLTDSAEKRIVGTAPWACKKADVVKFVERQAWAVRKDK